MKLQQRSGSLRHCIWFRLLLAFGVTGTATLRAQSLAWKERNAGAAISSYAGAAFGAGKYVVLAAASDTERTPKVLVSADAVTWTTTSLPAGGAWTGIGYGNGLFLAVSGSSTTAASVMTSVDGTNWTVRAAGTGALSAVAAAGGRFVAVGAENGGNNAAVSADGVTWTRVAVGQGSGALVGVVGHPTLQNFVAWNSTGNAWVSSDGTAWTRVTGLPTPDSAGGFSIAIAGGTYLAAVRESAGTQLYSSADGATWQAAGKVTEPPIESNRIGSFRVTGLAATDSAGSGNAVVAVAGYKSSAFNDPAGFFLFQSQPYSVVGSGTPAAWDPVVLPARVDPQNLIGVTSSWIFYANGQFLAAAFNGSLFTAPLVPAVVQQPFATPSVRVGDTITLSFSVSGPGLTYQWSRDGVAIPGATRATYSITSATMANAGTYTAVATSAYGSFTSTAAVLTVTPPLPGRIINLSILTTITPEAPTFKVGTVLGGGTTEFPKSVVIRAVGPSLAPLGVTNVLADPKIQVFNGTSANASVVAANDNWGGGSALAATMSQVGAFAFINGASRDAAVAPSLFAGNYVVEISGVGDTTGTVLAEVYDAAPANTSSTVLPRLINVSVLKHIGTGLTAGFVIGGIAPRTVLIRAVGPGLAPFGVSGLLADPKLELFDRAAKSLATNDDWGGSAAMSGAFTSVGAFALPAASRDAALLASLSPGNYTVQVSGVGGTTGVALVEVYELP